MAFRACERVDVVLHEGKEKEFEYRHLTGMSCAEVILKLCTLLCGQSARLLSSNAQAQLTHFLKNFREPSFDTRAEPGAEGGRVTEQG